MECRTNRPDAFRSVPLPIVMAGHLQQTLEPPPRPHFGRRPLGRKDSTNHLIASQLVQEWLQGATLDPYCEESSAQCGATRHLASRSPDTVTSLAIVADICARNRKVG